MTTDADYDLVDLHVGQTIGAWHFGFHVPRSPTKDVTYALYLDTDHVIGSGGTTDPEGYTISTNLAPGYRPEYVIYIHQHYGYYSSTDVDVYPWNGTGWGTVASLYSIGGSLNQYLNECNNYIEIRVPDTSIGYQTTAGSYTFSLLSLAATGGGTPKDLSLQTRTSRGVDRSAAFPM